MLSLSSSESSEDECDYDRKLITSVSFQLATLGTDGALLPSHITRILSQLDESVSPVTFVKISRLLFRRSDELLWEDLIASTANVSGSPDMLVRCLVAPGITLFGDGEDGFTSLCNFISTHSALDRESIELFVETCKLNECELPVVPVCVDGNQQLQNLLVVAFDGLEIAEVASSCSVE